MSSKTEALRRLKEFFEQHRIRYMIIGGLANAVWGEPRFTYDADVKVLLGQRTITEFGELVRQHFAFRRADAIAFAKRAYVLLIHATDEVPADLAIAFLSYEEQAMGRAKLVEIEGVVVPVCTAEDLIIHKAISERERDWLDIEGVLLRQRDKLDHAYILDWLEQFAATLERPEIIMRYKDLHARLTT